MKRLRRRWAVGLGLSAFGVAWTFVACGSDDSAPIEEACDGTCDAATLDSQIGDESVGDGTLPNDAPIMDSGPDGVADSSPQCDGGVPGTLDSTFGDNGFVWLEYPGAQLNSVALQKDGKILLGGKTTGVAGAGFAVVRLLATGMVDTSWGSGGIVEARVATSTHVLADLAVQPDGRIVGAGSARSSGQPTDVALVLLMPDGGLDPSFGDAGSVLSRITSRSAFVTNMVLLSDGKLLVGGYSEDRIAPDGSQDFEILRFNSDGALDTTFGMLGRVRIDVRGTSDTPGAIAVGADGRILVVGASAETSELLSRTDMAIARVTSAGVVDTTFCDGGRFTSTLAEGSQALASVAVSSTGLAFATGRFGSANPDDIATIRISAAGLDPTFANGVAKTDFDGRSDRGWRLVPDYGGRVLVVGGSGVGSEADTYGISMVRYMPDGTLDVSFGDGGRTFTAPPPASLLGTNAAVGSACHVLVAGTWVTNLNNVAKNWFGVARYHR